MHFYMVETNINIWKTYGIQSVSNFQMNNSLLHKLCMGLNLKTFKMHDKPMTFNMTEHEKIINMVSDSTLQPSSKKHHLVSFSVVSKKNIYNNLTKPMKIYSFSNDLSG